MIASLLSRSKMAQWYSVTVETVGPLTIIAPILTNGDGTQTRGPMTPTVQLIHVFFSADTNFYYTTGVISSAVLY